MIVCRHAAIYPRVCTRSPTSTHAHAADLRHSVRPANRCCGSTRHTEHVSYVTGDRARALCRAVGAALSEALPDGVEVVASGSTSATMLEARARGKGSAGTLVPGFGTPFPLVPRSLSAKLAMTEVLGTIQDLVSGAIHDDWPGPCYAAKAKVSDHSISLWLEGRDGSIVPAGTYSVSQLWSS
jgi:hypothetical protein